MSRIGKISVISKEYPQNFKTFESSLATAGYARAPGTHRLWFPHREKTGRYRTGLDENAEYLKKLHNEDKSAYEVEIKRIKEDKQRLEEKLGFKGILESTSPFWNYASPDKLLIDKFGFILRIEPVKMGNTTEIFDFSDAMREIQWNFMKVHPQIAQSLEAYMRGDSNPDAQYYVQDEEAENKATYSRKKLINQSISKFEAMGEKKQKMVARLMGLPITDETTSETVYNHVDNLLKQTEFKEGKYRGLSTVNIFNEIVKLKDASMEVKDLIEQAMRYNIYREGMNGKVTEGALDVAVDREALVQHLLDDKNQTDLLVLKKKLQEKKNNL